MAKKVFIGVGHGGSDPGAVANGFYEKNLNLVIATACNAELVRHGVETRMSRTTDENDTLTEEIKECNAFAPDLCIDIHNNAGGGDGVEAFYYSGGGTSKVLAQNVLDAVVAIGQNSRGIKTKLTSSGADYFGFIRETYAPACIVECAFVDNMNDLQIIDTEAEQKAMGVAIAKGILKTLGIAYLAPEVRDEATNETATAGTYRVKSGDSLWKIAAEQLGDGTRYKEIMALNGLTSDVIHVGTVLKIPGASEAPAPVEKPVYKTYTVKKNDNLWNIAVKYLGKGTRYKEIMALNGLTSDVIHAGMVLKIPN